MSEVGAAESATVLSSAPPLPRSAPVLDPLHSGIGVRSYFSLHVLAAIFPLTAGALLYGWRAIGTAAVVLLSTALAVLVWRRIGWRGWQVRTSHCLWLALLLSLMLPAHLFSDSPGRGGLPIPWPILPAAGIMIVMVSWLLGGIGAERIHPSLVTLLILFVLFQQLLLPRYVLRVDRLFLGDLLYADSSDQGLTRKDPWIIPPPSGAGTDSIESQPTSERLLAYTSAQRRPDRASLTLQMLIRDQMPPLEDLIIGGQPGPIGTSSGVAVIIGGLFLLYRGLIDFRIPLLATMAAMITLLILPIPVLITDTTTVWQWFAFREHYLGWSTAITFVNYEILASPLLFTAFFLATFASVRPITRRGRAIFAITLGVLSALFQLYASVSAGPYVALLIACLMTPTLDRVLRPRTLV